MSNVPKLRFREFSGEWEESKLNDIFKITAGGDIKSENVKEVKTDKFKYPIYANAEKNKGFYGYSNIYKIDKNVITVAGRGVNIGIAHARNHKFYPIVRLLILSPKQKININFFEYQINNMNIFIESTGVPQLTVPQISIYKLLYPLKQEQQKIASFLTSVDTKIEQLNKKKELLERYKKGIMQKIFSQEIRFMQRSGISQQSEDKYDDGSEFEDWKVKKLSEVLKTISTKSYQIKSSEIRDNGKYKVIDQGQKKIAGYSDNYSKIFKNNSVIVYGDHTTIVKFVDYNFIVGADGTKLLTTNDDNSLKYLFYNLEYNNIKAEGYKRHFSILKTIDMQLPQLKEQTKIANFLSSIDKKIELVTTQLKQTKEFKKGLLQQMFV